MKITYTSAKLIDEAETTICAVTEDGDVLSVPVGRNRYYRQLIKQGITIDPYQAVTSSWEDVTKLQSQKLGVNTEVTWRIMRYQTQDALEGATPSETPEKYQELLQYCEDIRKQNNSFDITPAEAITAINNLVVPIQDISS